MAKKYIIPTIRCKNISIMHHLLTGTITNDGDDTDSTPTEEKFDGEFDAKKYTWGDCWNPEYEN